jgi:predicted acyl esterase
LAETWNFTAFKEHQASMMTVGGWFDEDLYGPLNTYSTIEKIVKNYNTIVMGLWSHGDWPEIQKTGNRKYQFGGDSISGFIKKHRSLISSFFKGEWKGRINYLKLMF